MDVNEGDGKGVRKMATKKEEGKASQIELQRIVYKKICQKVTPSPMQTSSRRMQSACHPGRRPNFLNYLASELDGRARFANLSTDTANLTGPSNKKLWPSVAGTTTTASAALPCEALAQQLRACCKGSPRELPFKRSTKSTFNSFRVFATGQHNGAFTVCADLKIYYSFRSYLFPTLYSARSNKNILDLVVHLGTYTVSPLCISFTHMICPPSTFPPLPPSP